MGLFLKKKARELLEAKGVAGSYAVIGLCLVLVALNIITFTMFPRLLSPVAIILSNVITMIITALAFKPVSNLVQNTLVSKQQELAEKSMKEKEILQEIDDLRSRNLELESKLDTRLQADGARGEVNFTFKLEQMEYARSGYVVKEEDLDTLLASSEFRDKIPSKGFIPNLLETMNLKSQANRKILYIKKFYYKVSIGIDFTRIKFAFDDGTLLFSGVRFARLHDISSELEQDGEDINHTWILNTSEEKASIIQSPDYDKLKESYARIQETDTKEALEEDVERMCRQHTQVFRKSIKDRFPQVDFVEGIEDSDKTWYALKEAGKDPRVVAVASSMLMLTDVINHTQ